MISLADRGADRRWLMMALCSADPNADGSQLAGGISATKDMVRRPQLKARFRPMEH
jgi:hypothetical protein